MRGFDSRMNLCKMEQMIPSTRSTQRTILIANVNITQHSIGWEYLQLSETGDHLYYKGAEFRGQRIEAAGAEPGASRRESSRCFRFIDSAAGLVWLQSGPYCR